MKERWLGVVVACSLATPAMLRADAVNLSHLQCFKIKDPLPPATYKADQLLGEVGCVIRVPAKLLCSSTSKVNVSPTPPGGGPDLTLNEISFLCYKEKCPKTNVSIPTLKDQFGTHLFMGALATGITSKMLCAPASPSGAFLDGSDLF